MKMPSQNRELKVRRVGLEESPWDDIYHRLLLLSWPKFFCYLFLTYVCINLIFASLYFASPDSIANIKSGNFFSYFGFSVQTMATIGYGYYYPQTSYAHVLVTIESALSLFLTAVLTGLVFAKFSRPAARVVFSDLLLLIKQNDKDALMMRLGNIRANRVFEGHARITLLKDETTKEGDKIRRLVDLKLLRDETPIFALSWSLFHFIDESSPLFNVSPEEMIKNNWEFIVTFTGLDQDMAQTIVAHSTYSATKLTKARKFVDMINYDQGTRVIDFSKLNQVEY